MKAGTYARGARLLLSKKGAWPEYITFFVTANCNLACKHCFYWKNLNQCKNELSTKEIEEIAKSIPHFHFLLLTGGEPLLRPDLAEVIDIFKRHCGVQKVQIATNGYYNARMQERLHQLVHLHADLSVNISFSVDGTPAVHDEIRDRAGAFSRTLDACRALQAQRSELPHLAISTITTFSRRNQHEILGIYEAIKSQFDPDFMSFPLIRGDPKDPSYTDVDLTLFEELLQRLDNDHFVQLTDSTTKHFGSTFIAASKRMANQLVAKTARENAYQTPCYAGIINAVIYENGDVYPCELLEDRRMGSLRDVDFDFSRVWFSTEADEIRKMIRETNCFCVHGCNSIGNILFNPKNLLPLANDALRIVATRRSKSARSD